MAWIGVVLEVPILGFCVHTNEKIFEVVISSFSYFHSVFVHTPLPGCSNSANPRLVRGFRDHVAWPPFLRSRAKNLSNYKLVRDARCQNGTQTKAFENYDTA
jgi:hypothetical protein